MNFISSLNFGSNSVYHFCPNGTAIIVTPTVSLTSTKVSGKEKYKPTCIKGKKKFPASLQEMKETNYHFTFESIVLLRKIAGSRLAGGRKAVNLNFKLITCDYTLYLQQCWPLSKEVSYKEHTYLEILQREICSYIFSILKHLGCWKAGSNTSIAALRVVRGDEKETPVPGDITNVCHESHGTRT